MRRPPKLPRRETATAARPGICPAARLAALGLVLGAAALAPGCAGAKPAPRAAEPIRSPASPAAPVAAGDNLSAFRALQAALADEDDALARGIVAGLRTRALSSRERELVDSAERVLAGRELVGALDLRLESEPVPDTESSFRLVLVARSSAPGDVVLRLPPADLKRFRSHIDARGLEGLDYESKGTAALAEIALAPTVERRVPLVEYELPLGRALAVRERWRLEPRSGEIDSGGARYPAARITVVGCERERVSPLIAEGSTAPGALAAALAAPDAPSRADLLRLALRLPAEAREAELAELASVVADLAERAPERVAAAEPALRWLTGNRDLGVDAPGWARFLAARSSAADGAADGAAEAAADGLDLPGSPRRTR